MRYFISGLFLRGVPFSAAGFLAAAWAFSIIDLPETVLSVLALFPVLFGVWFHAGYTAKRTRRNGTRWGILCALALSGGWTLLSVSFTSFGFPICMALSVPVGIWGGVYGVNRPAPAIRRRAHAARRVVPNTALALASAAAVCRTRKMPGDAKRTDTKSAEF